MRIQKLIIFFIFVCIFNASYAQDFSQLHTHNVRALLNRVSGSDIPRIQVCLRHYLSGDCLPGAKNLFFTCDSAQIDQYIACISDRNLNKKIAAAYKEMYEAGQKAISEIEKDEKMPKGQKSVMLAKMRAALNEYSQTSKSEAQTLAQIDQALASYNRFSVASFLRDPKVRERVNNLCKSNPRACLGVQAYYKRGQELLQQFDKRFDDAEKEFSETFGGSLEAALKTELELALKCLGSSNQETFCKTFVMDPSLASAVTQEIQTGICNHHVSVAKMTPKIQKRFDLICNQYQHYLRYISTREAGNVASNPDKRSATGAPDAAKSNRPDNSKAHKNAKRTTSSNGNSQRTVNGSEFSMGQGEAGGRNVNQSGYFTDWATEDMEEQVYNCSQVDTAVEADCDVGENFAPTSDTATDLAAAANSAAEQCAQQVNPYHRAQMDAASYMIETQVRAYVNRLNFDPNISETEYERQISALKNSCELPPIAAGECNYESVLKRKTREFVDSISNQALAQRKNIGFESKLSQQFLDDSVKAAQDLKEIDGTLRGLLANFPEPQKSWKEIWPDVFPCQSVVGIMDEVRTIWNSSHYETRCSPIEVSEKEIIQQSDEEIYQYFRAVELGLVEGVTLETLPDNERIQKRLGRYREMRKSKEFTNDLDGRTKDPVQLDQKHSSMFYGATSESGRVVTPPGMLSGLESRKFECKKKAQQVKKLMNMKLSILANYPQLANKTFTNGTQPTEQWQFWDENCRGQSRYSSTCNGLRGNCKTVVKKGCESEPSDWSTQDKPKNLYEQLGDHSDNYEEMIGKQFSLDQARGDMQALKKSIKSICNDPLEAGAEVLKDDHLYTLYASCALQNAENGQRRVASDLDEYTFWKEINNSKESKARCAKRASESYHRCYIVRHLNSGAGNILTRGVAQAAVPLVNTLDFAGCVAMFTGVGGAIYSGIRAGATAGVAAGVRAGSSYLGGEIFAAGRSLVSPLGATITVGGVGLSYHYAEVAEKEYDNARAQHAAGLASEEDVTRARKSYEETRLYKNLQTILAGALIPGGGENKPKVKVSVLRREFPTGIPDFPRGTLRSRVAAVDEVVPPPRKLGFIDPARVERPTVTSESRNLALLEDVPVPLGNRESAREAVTSVSGARKTAQESTVASGKENIARQGSLSVTTPVGGGGNVGRALEATTPVGGALSERAARAATTLAPEPSIYLHSSVDHIDESIRVLRSEGDEVLASLGTCCSKSWQSQQSAVDTVLIDAVSTQDKNPYFIGHHRRPGSEIRPERVRGYDYTPPSESLALDFAKEYPGLENIRLNAFELDGRGRLTSNAKDEALRYIAKHLPDADNYNIEYLAQGGFNAVFKACPKAGGRCKVVKLPGMDRTLIQHYNELQGRLKDLDSHIDGIRTQLLDPDTSREQVMAGRKMLEKLEQKKSLLKDELQDAENKVAQAIESYRLDLGLIAWGDELLESGKGPRLDGHEFMSHGSINRDPKLLENGIVVQDYYGVNAPDSVESLVKSMNDSAGDIVEGSVEHAIVTRFYDPTKISADMQTIMEFSSLCNSAKVPSVQTYCQAVRSANKMPDHQELVRMTQAGLQFFEDTHNVVGRSVFNNFGQVRANPTRVMNAVEENGVLKGPAGYSPIGFDPLGGKNAFFDTSTGHIVLADR